MTRIKALRGSIKTRLEDICGIKFYSEYAPGWAKPPFGVFSLLLIRRGESQDQYDLMVNIADSGADADTVEALTEACARGLDQYDYFDAGQSWTAWLSGISPVDHADITLHQRRLSFDLTYTTRRTDDEEI